MAFNLGNGIWNSVFAVPDVVVDEHLKIASGLSVKVFLLLLRHGGALEAEDISRLVGHSAADVQDALNYWIEAGVFAPKTADNPHVPPLQYIEVPDEGSSAEIAPVPPQPEPCKERRLTTISSSRHRLSTQEINEMAQKDENIGCLLQEAQTVLGKTLTPVATDTIVALYVYHGMQPDLILMLIHYCVSIGRDSMRYIERVAADWMDKGVDSHEKAEAEILRLTKRNTIEGRIKSAFGIHDRNLISSEKQYIHTWTEQYRMDIPMITLAYERTIELKGKLSFPYINGILTNWHNNGISTTTQAAREIREKGDRVSQSVAHSRSSYEMSELEKLIAHEEIL